ncbi:MAG: Uma2 family endonuclease [Proteobacteria bacterium]|nr:Uma2 family endonuclease [Pseudomonadota bacterium]MBW3616633.1 Uma2 family endonuclease [Pseudomonadota bacterium]
MNALTQDWAARGGGEPRPMRFTIDQVRAMVAAGVIEKNAPLQLIDGELIEMPADGPRHRDYTNALGVWLFGSLDPGRFVVLPQSTLELSEENGPEPDWYVFGAELRTAEVRGPDVLLAVEQSDTTLSFDLNRKATLYARFGIRDYWVVDLERRRVHVHRDPTAAGYETRRVFAAHEAVEALLIPGLNLRIEDLPRVGG